MIEVVQVSDLELFESLRRDNAADRRCAMTTLEVIIERMERPRAYLVGPPAVKDRAIRGWWTRQMDMLSAFAGSYGYGVIEPETLLLLITHCPPFQQAFVRGCDPFLIPLAQCKLIDEIWIPAKWQDDKRYNIAIQLADKFHRRLVLWHPFTPRARHRIFRP